MEKQKELTEKHKEIIYKTPLFEGLPDNDRDGLLDSLDYSVHKLSKGEIVIKQGSSCLHLNILLEGKLEVNIIDVSGNNFKVEDIIAPRAFATPHLFNDNNIYPATFTVVEEGILLKATKDSVFRLISSIPNLLKNFLRVSGNCNRCTVSRLKILSYKGIRSRFVSYLFDHMKDAESSIMEHNQTQLAEYIGVTRPALAKEIGKMEKEGLIEINGKSVKILSRTKLTQHI